MKTPPTKRTCIPETTTRLVAASQAWRCACCDELLTAFYEIDHSRALALGGDNSRRNLQALCPACHRAKTHGDVNQRNSQFGRNFMMLFTVGAQEDKWFRGVVLGVQSAGYSVAFEDGDKMRVPFRKTRDAARWVWI